MLHDDFRKWMKYELDKRYWTYNELARRASLSSATVSMVMTGRRNPGLDFCTSVGRAFGVDAVVVLQKAGLLPPRSLDDELTEEVLFLFENLAPDDQDRLLIMMRGLRTARRDTGEHKGGTNT